MIEHLYNKVVRLYSQEMADLTEGMGPAHVVAYLDSEPGWRLDKAASSVDAQVWVKRAGESDVATVRVPMVKGWGDYDRRWEEMLSVIAVVDDWPLHVTLDVPARLRDVRRGGDGAE